MPLRLLMKVAVSVMTSFYHLRQENLRNVEVKRLRQVCSDVDNQYVDSHLIGNAEVDVITYVCQLKKILFAMENWCRRLYNRKNTPSTIHIYLRNKTVFSDLWFVASQVFYNYIIY